MISRLFRTSIAPALVGTLLVFTSTNAVAEDIALASEVCTKIFGSNATREENARERQAKVHQVRSMRGQIEVVHAVPKWGAPARTRLPGVDIRGTTGEGVRIAVDQTYGEICPEGEYELRVDDAIGADGRVLAIKSNAVLIERGEKLSYLAVDTRMTQAPKFRMVWRSDFYWVAQNSGGGKGSGGGAITASSRSRPESTTSTSKSRTDRKARNESARMRARSRSEANKSPKNVINSLPTTQLAKELKKSSRR